MEYSTNCVMSKFASHLANRRSRLNKFAAEFRTIIEGEGIPLQFDEMLDGRAEEVERILTKHGVVVPPPLRTQPPFLSEDLETDLYRKRREKGGMNYCSIYAVISSVQDAELFWELGFRGLNSQNPNRKISPLAFMTISCSLPNDAYVVPAEDIALGATHTCCHFIFSEFWTTVPQDDIESIQEEEEAILELLESLLLDFEREVSVILEIQPLEAARFVDFWRGYWFPKMRDVLADLDTDKLPEEIMSKTEELGVVWYGPEMEEVSTVQKHDGRDPWQYWWDELDKIVVRKEME
ncbi:hypothetical protein PG995_000207 [Apiospora arundinis]